MYKLIPLFLLFVVAACSKNEQEQYTPAQHPQYQNSHLSQFGAYKLYTVSGEVWVPGLAQQYASELGQYFYDESSTFEDPAFRTFQMVSEDSALNTSTVPVGELKRRTSGTYDQFSGHWWNLVNDTNTLSLHIGKYKFHKTVTTPGGFTYLDLESPTFFFKKRGDTLYFPMVRYITISRRPGITSFSADRINNVFDPAGVRKLGPNDTLLVQTFELAMKRVN